jgi:peptidoglycan/xylan/chitin deacetylase (PgdA/CDA1 family)
MINIMYHYVRPDNSEYPYFNNLNIEIFKNQLDYFEKKYGFLSQEKYKNAIKNKININGAILTFDDGFKDHYSYVMPELKKRGLWGIFYISTGIYKEKKLLGVHRVHYLKGKYGAGKILDELVNEVKDYMLDHDTINEFDKEIYIHSSYENDEKQLRRLLNYYIKYEYRDTILDTLMDKFFDKKELFKNVYLSKKEIIELQNNGNIIGSHTISHPVLSRLTYAEQYNELSESFNFLDKIVKQNYKSFCYPYGYNSSYNQDTLNILKKLNVDDACIFDNKIQDNDIKQYEISRIDCNQFMEV